jgi:tRNA dimethylallyltransferase
VEKPKKLIVILGPTAVGKSALAIRVAQHYHTEIISADSRQIFKELNIGVARPTEEELSAVPHHFIAHRSIHDKYSAGSYEREALSKLETLFAEHDVVVCCGGSMMYVDALVKGLDDLPSDEKIREKIVAEYQERGIAVLQEKLKSLDPIYYEDVDKQNPHRLIRALEVCEITGRAYSALRIEAHKPRNFEVVTIGLTAQRNWLYSRINKRVDAMFALGLEEEAKSVHAYAHLNALNTVGYKELFDFFDGKCSLEEAKEKIKQHSRNFAKRQLTWWRRDERIQWVAADSSGDMLNYVVQQVDTV